MYPFGSYHLGVHSKGAFFFPHLWEHVRTVSLWLMRWNTCTSSDNGSQQVGICGGLAPLTVHGGDGIQSTFTPSNVSDESVLLWQVLILMLFVLDLESRTEVVFTSFSEKLIAQKEVKDMPVSHISAKLYIILYSSYMVNGISLLNMWLTTFLYCRPFFPVIKLTFDRIEFIWSKNKIATLEIKFCLRVSSTSLLFLHDTFTPTSWSTWVEYYGAIMVTRVCQVCATASTQVINFFNVYSTWWFIPFLKKK